MLQGWYGRLRRDHVTTDACTVAAHMAFLFVGAGDEPGAHAIDQRSLFVLLSSRVFLNVHQPRQTLTLTLTLSLTLTLTTLKNDLFTPLRVYPPELIYHRLSVCSA